MSDENPNAHRTAAGRESTLDDHERRLDALEASNRVAEFKEIGREKRVNRAITAVISLSVAIASGVVVALASGGHL